MVPPNGCMALANLSSVTFEAMITTAEWPGSSRCSTRYPVAELGVDARLVEHAHKRADRAAQQRHAGDEEQDTDQEPEERARHGGRTDDPPGRMDVCLAVGVD